MEEIAENGAFIISRLDYIFDINKLYGLIKEDKNIADVVFGCDDFRLFYNSHLKVEVFFPSMRSKLSVDEKVYWWPICDN